MHPIHREEKSKKVGAKRHHHKESSSSSLHHHQQLSNDKDAKVILIWSKLNSQSWLQACLHVSQPSQKSSLRGQKVRSTYSVSTSTCAMTNAQSTVSSHLHLICISPYTY